MSCVYLIHFHTPLKHARHYLGYVSGSTKKVEERLERHRRGQGARLLQVVTELGITFEVVRVWKGKQATRTFERKLKRRKCSPKLCPICQKEKRRANVLNDSSQRGEGNGGSGEDIHLHG